MAAKIRDIESSKIAKEPTYPGFWKNLSEYFSDFSQCTTIHAVRYLGNKRLSVVEKLWWLITIGISIMLCFLLILKTYNKWISTPIIVSFAKTTTPIWKIPYPAVTVCAETKAKQTIYNYTDAYHKFREEPQNISEEDVKKFEDISLICNNYPYTKGRKFIDSDIIDFYSEVAPKHLEMLWMCRWINQNATCDSLFVPTITDEGLCYTFNMLDREDLFTDNVFFFGNYSQHGLRSIDWNLEKGYARGIRVNTFPRRAVAAGHAGSFGVVMRLFDPDLDYLCKGPIQGFKVLIHNPAELPIMSQQHFWAPLDSNVVVTITPDMMTTADELRKYSSDIRQCYFSHERELAYFQVYTQRSCQVECVTNYTLRTCGCVGFHMPRNESTEICGPGSIECMTTAQNDVTAREVQEGLDAFEDMAHKRNEQLCNCLPACTSLSYNVESSQAFFDWNKLFEAYKVNRSEFPGIRVTRVDFIFKQPQFITSERNELYGVSEFLAHCGGLLALFIGFSLLSLIEIIYWLTLRLVCNIKEYGHHFWSGSINLIKKYAFTANQIKIRS